MFSIGGIQISWRDLADMILVSVVFYRLILLVKGTRAVSVIYGLLFLLLIYYASGEFGLFTLNWLLANFLGSIFLVVIIIFQTDIRKALAAVGAGKLWKSGRSEDETLNEIVLACVAMSQAKIGALIIIEKNIPLGDYTTRGVEINGKLSKDLILTIFNPKTPLHDGAVIVRNNMIVAAACILPLAVGLKHHSHLGTRHRAAMGVTEESDAIAVVVSEERGTISVSLGGRLTLGLDEFRLQRVLQNALER